LKYRSSLQPKGTLEGSTYNCYTGKQRAQIGKYAAENGPTRAAKNFAALWKVDMNESTEDSEKDETVDTLPKCKQGRPLLLGEDLDAAVQEYVETQRAVGTAINSTVVMAAAEGIISVRDVSKLVEHGGHTDITKSWAKLSLNRMGYVKEMFDFSRKDFVSRL